MQNIVFNDLCLAKVPFQNLIDRGLQGVVIFICI
jgi:hypothetical protein